jgi:hypothetical protein
MLQTRRLNPVSDCPLTAALLRYFAPGEIGLTGGVAVELHLAQAGLPPLRERIEDLDFVARRVEGTVSGIATEFLVSHYHRAGPGVSKALLQLVDPRTRLRIDIFPDLDGTLDGARPANVAGVELGVLSASSILEHKLRTIAKSTAASPADPKHWRDAVALAALLGRTVPPPAVPFAQTVFRTDPEIGCPRCDRSRDEAFPLAPKREILALLGYV